MAIGASDLASEMESKLKDSIESLYDVSVSFYSFNVKQNQLNSIFIKSFMQSSTGS